MPFTTKQKIGIGIGSTALLATLFAVGPCGSCAKHEEEPAPESTPPAITSTSTPTSGSGAPLLPPASPAIAPTTVVTVTVTPIPPAHPSGIYDCKVLGTYTLRKSAGDATDFMFRVQLKPEGSDDSEYRTYLIASRYEDGKVFSEKVYVRDLFFGHTRPDGLYSDKYLKSAIEADQTDEEPKQDTVNTPDYNVFGPRTSPSPSPTTSPSPTPSVSPPALPRTSYNSLDRLISYNPLNK